MTFMHSTTGVRSRPWYVGAGLVTALALVLSTLVPAAGGTPTVQAAARSATSAPTLTLAPQSGVPNQALAITITNFITNTPITIDFVEGTTHTTLAMLTLSGGTEFSFNTAVPLAATPGTAYVEACYSTTSCTAVVAFAAFTVSAFGATLTPNPALPGQTVTISGTGFAAGESVSVTLGGALLFAVTTSSVPASAGSFGGSFSAPLAAGVYTVTATGLSSGYQFSTPLTVQAPSTSTSTPVPSTSTSTAVPPTATPPATSTGTPFPTGTSTPVPPSATSTPVPPSATSTPVPPSATSTPIPVNTATALPTATPTSCPGNSCAAHFCPRGSHGVHGHCVANAAHLVILVRPVHPRVQRHVTVRVIVKSRVVVRRTIVKTTRPRVIRRTVVITPRPRVVVHRTIVITPRPRVRPHPGKVVIISRGKGHGKRGVR